MKGPNAEACAVWQAALEKLYDKVDAWVLERDEIEGEIRRHGLSL